MTSTDHAWCFSQIVLGKKRVPLNPHVFALPPMPRRPTDGYGCVMAKQAAHGDGQGYGRFFGAGSTGDPVASSRLSTLACRIITACLWRDLPRAAAEQRMAPSLCSGCQQVQRPASTARGNRYAIAIPDQPPVTLLTFYATPPVSMDQRPKRQTQPR